jgi:agmatine deiminase
MYSFTRRRFIAAVPTVTVPLLIGGGFLVGCGGDTTQDGDTTPTAGDQLPSSGGGWRMPAEEDPHERTWMCWPSSDEVWGTDLASVQDAIVAIAQAIAGFEPVTMLARPEEIEALRDIFSDEVELLEAPVDDLWARDTLPNFVVRAGQGGAEIAAAHATFNGWGDKQIHAGDTQLAGVVAAHLGVQLFDFDLVGEGGAVEIDGRGTVLAAESCWVNDNRNPGKSQDEIEQSILEMLGADRMIWVEGLAGADITDGHIDTLARFANHVTIVVDKPAFDDPADPWVAVAATTKSLIEAATTADGEPYKIVEIVQPSEIRGSGDDFLATYMNYYVCNGAVIAPQFGDTDADDTASAVLAGLFPDREIVMLNIDALAAGGGGIHCATQQQPRAR